MSVRGLAGGTVIPVFVGAGLPALLGWAAALFALPAVAQNAILPFSTPLDAGNGKPAAALSLQAFAGNDPVSLQQFAGDWQGDYHPRSGRNLGILSARMELGAHWEGWSVGRVARRDILVDFSRDTTDLYHLYKTRQAAPAGETFALDARYLAYGAEGWRLAKAWTWQGAAGESWSLGLGYATYGNTAMRVGSANGNIQSLGGGDYRYALNYSDAYTSNVYPFIKPGQPSGHGQSWELGGRWCSAGGTRITLLGNDLFGRMHWREIPTTVARADTSTASTGADGYIAYQPALSGRNRREDWSLGLSPRWLIEAEVPVNNVRLLTSVSALEGNVFPLAGARWRLAGNWQIQADYDFRFETVGVRLQHPLGFLALRTDSAHLSQAKAYGLSAVVNIPFP